MIEYTSIEIEVFAMSNEKLKEMIKYITASSIEDRCIGRVKLYKLIFFCDFEFYKLNGNSISGEQYHKQQHGPVLDCIKPTIEELKQDKTFMEIKTLDGRFKPVIQGDINYDLFTKEEIIVINNMINRFTGMTATQVSQISHELIPDWDDIFMENELPLEASLGSGVKPPDDAIAYVESNLDKYKTETDAILKKEEEESNEFKMKLFSTLTD